MKDDIHNKIHYSVGIHDKNENLDHEIIYKVQWPGGAYISDKEIKSVEFKKMNMKCMR